MTLKYQKQQSSLKTIPQFQLTHKVNALRIRSGTGGYVNGIWQEGVSTSSTIEVNIQPLKGWELMSMPEADRSREWVKIYTTSDLRGVQDGDVSTAAPSTADLIVWDGRTFEVAKVSTYKMGVLDHTKAIAVRVEAGT